jgi:hypothetical protein
MSSIGRQVTTTYKIYSKVSSVNLWQPTYNFRAWKVSPGQASEAKQSKAKQSKQILWGQACKPLSPRNP